MVFLHQEAIIPSPLIVKITFYSFFGGEALLLDILTLNEIIKYYFL